MDQGSVAVIRATGELDLHTARDFSARVNATMRETACGMVVDLSDVSFIDSSALAVLLNLQRRMTRAGRRLALAVPEGPVARTLEIAHLTSTFDVSPTLETATARAAR